MTLVGGGLRPRSGVDGGQCVDRAADGEARLVHDVQVDHRRAHVRVAEQFLHGADIGSALE